MALITIILFLFHHHQRAGVEPSLDVTPDRQEKIFYQLSSGASDICFKCGGRESAEEFDQSAGKSREERFGEGMGSGAF